MGIKLNPLDIVGQKIGRLTVEEYLGYYKKGNRKSYQYFYKCKCDCGAYKNETSREYLFSAVSIKSCGCWNIQRTVEFNKTTKTEFNNKYEKIGDDYYIEIISKNKKYNIIVDEYGFNFLKEINRTLSIDNRGYAYITKENRHKVKRNQMFIHNLFVFGLDYYETDMNILVDHKNGNKQDNRLENLRPADLFENTQNAKMRKDNTLGIKGFSICITNSPTVYIRLGIQAYKNRIRKNFILSPEGLEKAIIWNYNTRKELHGEYANFGFDFENKTLDEIIKEQSEIFISNLTEEQLKIFNNNGYKYQPIKNKPRKL